MRTHVPQKIDAARELLKRPNGASVKEIARRTRRSVRAVRRWMNLFNKEGVLVRFGIPIRYRLERRKRP